MSKIRRRCSLWRHVNDVFMHNLKCAQMSGTEKPNYVVLVTLTWLIAVQILDRSDPLIRPHCKTSAHPETSRFPGMPACARPPEQSRVTSSSRIFRTLAASGAINGFLLQAVCHTRAFLSSLPGISDILYESYYFYYYYFYNSTMKPCSLLSSLVIQGELES